MLAPDSDLGERLVTIGVGRLDSSEVAAALDRGMDAAGRLLRAGLIEAAALFLAGEARFSGGLSGKAPFECLSVKEPAHA